MRFPPWKSLCGLVAGILWAGFGISRANEGLTLPAETATDRAERHARVATRRAGTILIAHRGAATLARENTIAAYAAAMDFGADGCEVDVRRTADGVLVLFHDDMLDRLTDGLGRVEELSHAGLLRLNPQRLGPFVAGKGRPPTLRALLLLARQRAMLLHLDVKLPGLGDVLARVLDEADMWDHVVAVNGETLAGWKGDPRFKPLAYKGALYEQRLDADPAAVHGMLARPGQMVMLEDPRLAARELGRPAYVPIPWSEEIKEEERRAVATRMEGRKEASEAGEVHAASPGNYDVSAAVRRLEERYVKVGLGTWVGVLRGAPDGRRLSTSDEVVERAWAAEHLGRQPLPRAEVLGALEFRVDHPSLHPDWILNGLDAHVAARALGRLKAIQSVPVLIGAFRRVDPDLEFVRNRAFGNTPLAWVDWRKWTILTVLGELSCPEARAFLRDYVALPEAVARELSVPQFEEATFSLLRQSMGREDWEALLRSPNPAVRGTAILSCVDRPTREGSRVLRELAPWTLGLPRAR